MSELQVNASWEKTITYDLKNANCPYCGVNLYTWDINQPLYEGQAFNNEIECPECDSKFVLNIEGDKQ